MRGLYPSIEPVKSGLLDVGDGHSIFYECSGNPAGQPACFLHGGPGGGCSPASRCFFDPAVYMIVTFDQRGCGRSTPNAAVDYEAAMRGNDTPSLVADIERLREHLGVKRWGVVLGGSWGSTLAVAYAEAHPTSLAALVLRGVFLFMPHEVDALFQDGSQASNHPEAWDLYLEHIRSTSDEWALESTNLLGAYYKRLTSPDEAIRHAAAYAFVAYELSVSTTFPNEAKVDRVLSTPSLLVPFALFEAHYMLHAGFIRRGQLLDDLPKIKHLQVAIVHGRCDFVCQPASALRLFKALDPDGTRNDVTIEIVHGAGHSDSEPGIIDALIRATDNLRP